MKNKIVLISAAFVLVTAALMFTGCGDPGGGGGTNAATPTITTQPQDATYIYGRDVTVAPLTVVATVSDGGKLSYQWYYATSLTGAGEKISGETDSYYEPYEFDPTYEDEQGVYYYYVVVTNTNSKATGKKTASKTSERATVTFTESDDWDAVTPQITAQPQSATYTAGSDETLAPLTVTAIKTSNSGMLSYQWYENTTASNEGGTAVTTGGTTASYTPAIDLSDEQSMGVFHYYVIVTNTDTTAPGANKSASVTSDVATITVTAGENWPAATPTITVPPVGNVTTFAGDPALVPLSVTAEIQVAEPQPGTLSYQWYKATTANADGETVGTNSSTYALTDDLSTYGEFWYYVVVTNTNDNAPGEKIKTATSTRARITIIDGEKPIITDPTLGGNKSFNIGADAATAPVLNGAATVPNGDTPTYAWYSNATQSTTGGTPVDGATSPTFKPADLSVESNAFYYVVVTNGTKTATSGAARYAVSDSATPYIISGSGSSFSATRRGTAVGTAGAIDTVISAIKQHSAGSACTVQFGDLSSGTTGTITITGDVSAVFNNASDSPSTPWGLVTITGKVTGSRAGNLGTVVIGDTSTATTIHAIIQADIENTNTGSSTSLAATGKALSVGVTAESEVEVQSGTLKATGGGGNAVFVNAGTVKISGGTATSVNVQANTTSGTVNQSGSGAVIITGTAIVANTENNASARTVYSNSSGATTITGGSVTCGGANSRVVSVASSGGRVHLAGGPTLSTTCANNNSNIYYTNGNPIIVDAPITGGTFKIHYGTVPDANEVVVQGGGPYPSNFSANGGALAVTGNNLTRNW